MGFWNFRKKQEEIKVENEPLFSNFSTPFGKIGDGNLSLPYVRNYGSEPYVRFGSDNLFPQIINQMYYQSPLNGSIINFKTNATIGGGIEINSTNLSAADKVNEYTFIKANKIDKLARQITKDFIMHSRICILVDPTKKQIRLKRVGPEKVRINAAKTKVTLSDDWSRSIGIVEYPVYNPSLKVPSVYVYENEGDAGQDIYPIPQYTSALNWCFVDGESAYLHKSNLINAIFPSFMLTLAKKFGSTEELAQFKDTIEKAKGAPNAGRIMTFVATSSDQLPTITPIPKNSNDSLFTETDERIDANICRAHSIDPLIMGIRVSGKLGSGNELSQSYNIFEKNIVMPLRQEIEEVLNELMFMAGLTSTITINDYQIVNGEIKQTLL